MRPLSHSTVDSIAGAIARLAREQGTPNAFAVSEIAGECRRAPMYVDRVLGFQQTELDRRLNERGFRLAGRSFHEMGVRMIRIAPLSTPGP